MRLGKRLAQCLNPALPAGVHNKTLDLYECIFETLGAEKTAEDFFVIAYGLFPFFEYCSSSIRTRSIGLAKKYIVPICPALLQSLTGLLLAYLPGLEDESSEHFKPTMDLLLEFADQFGLRFYTHSIVSVFVCSARHRLYCVNFIGKTNFMAYDLSDSDDRVSFMQLVQTGLQDENPIVVRGMMDFVSEVTVARSRHPQIPDSYMHDLIFSMLNVLKRKDMSLSRRFYSWIELFSTTNKPMESPASLVGHSLLRYITTDRSSTDLQMIAMFKVLICLLDNGPFAEPIVSTIVLELVDYTKREYARRSKDPEFLKSANQFFELVDLNLVWKQFLQFISDNQTDEKLNLLDFAVKYLRISEPAVVNIYFEPIVCHVLSTFCVLCRPFTHML